MTPVPTTSGKDSICCFDSTPASATSGKDSICCFDSTPVPTTSGKDSICCFDSTPVPDCCFGFSAGAAPFTTDDWDLDFWAILCVLFG